MIEILNNKNSINKRSDMDCFSNVFFGFSARLAISQFTILILNYFFYVGIRFLAGCLESDSNPGPLD